MGRSRNMTIPSRTLATTDESPKTGSHPAEFCSQDTHAVIAFFGTIYQHSPATRQSCLCEQYLASKPKIIQTNHAYPEHTLSDSAFSHMGSATVLGTTALGSGMFVVSHFSRCYASYGFGSGVGDMGVVGLVDNEFGRFGDNKYMPRSRLS
jgi:hypothetical protein